MKKSPWLATLSIFSSSVAVWAACGYFEPDRGPQLNPIAVRPAITQPGQRAFLTWDEQKQLESFTVQPEFSGNAKDFGMVIPTPNRPKLQEMPKDFFSALGTFTTLLPLDTSKFRMPVQISAAQSMNNSKTEARSLPPQVKILERGIVGTLDYKILEANDSRALTKWLRDNRYSYRGQEAILDSYVKKHWYFTVMKIDSRNMKKRPDGTFLGEVTPSRFTFQAARLIYPLRITRVSVIDSTDVQLYVLARKKMDMEGTWSFEPNFWWAWKQSMAMAYPNKLTPEDKLWLERVKNWNPRFLPAGSCLEWTAKLTPQRLQAIQRGPAPRILTGHLKPGWTLTKIRKRFQKKEMDRDINFVPASILGIEDDVEYISQLPVPDPNSAGFQGVAPLPSRRF